MFVGLYVVSCTTATLQKPANGFCAVSVGNPPKPELKTHLEPGHKLHSQIRSVQHYF
jgi:hypothetical protein